MKFATITLNPSFDLTFELDALHLHEVQVAKAEHLQAAGKGINVARCLEELDASVDAVALVGNDGADDFRSRLALRNPLRVVSVQGRIRTNVALATEGNVTKINGAGPTLSAAQLDGALPQLLAAASGADWVAICGSAPRGVPPTFFARLVRGCIAAGARVALDVGGDVLRACLDARPHLCKPNRDELAAAAQRPIRTMGDAVDAAHTLRSLGADAVLASFGSGGIVYVDEHRVLHATTKPIEVVSDVGAGDSALAGFLSAVNDPVLAIRRAAAFGRAACLCPASTLPHVSDVDFASVEVTTMPELLRPLD